jgi:hypothetical protein
MMLLPEINRRSGCTYQQRELCKSPDLVADIGHVIRVGQTWVVRYLKETQKIEENWEGLY